MSVGAILNWPTITAAIASVGFTTLNKWWGHVLQLSV
jgi:hypothetical protein